MKNPLNINEFIDEKWYEEILSVSKDIPETYMALEPLPELLSEKRKDFESSGYNQDISLFPEESMAVSLQPLLEKLQRLKLSIKAKESNPLVAKVYIDFIERSLSNVHMIIASARQDMDRFNKENRVLYDEPDIKVFGAVCSWIRYDAEKTLRETTSTTLISRAQEVLRLIPDSKEDYDLLIPSEQVFDKVRQLHRQPGGFYDLLFGPELLPDKSYIDQSEGDGICHRVLKNIGSDYALSSSSNNIWATMRDKKLLVRPKGYRLDKDEFIGIISHEIGSHILESTNGAKQPLRLLEMGLAGYEKGNEGRAFLREQIVYEDEATFLHQFSWEYIVLLHLSVSLVAGCDKKPYSFSELYALLRALYAFWHERRHPFDTDTEIFAHEEAWYLAVRIFKGTDGKNGAYLKDAVYLEGNIKCWQLAAKDPSIILKGDIGKFDITNPDHVSTLKVLNIL